MIDGKDYSFITCTNHAIGHDLDSKLIHNNDVEFRLQQLQITYPDKQFRVTRCRS